LVIKVVDASTSLDQEIAIENYNWILLFHFLTFKNFLKQKGGHKGKQKFDANMLRVKLLILKTANKFVLT
jgi:hypothetical protein